MSRYLAVQEELQSQPRRWLITGVAGFIGSNLLETLLKLNQHVVGLDNFSTGYLHNLEEVQANVMPEQWQRFRLIQGDIRRLDDCQRACEAVDFVLHQAALGSVPRSISDPVATNQSNVDGFLNMLVAARDAQVRSFTYAASSSTYGDHPDLPKQEDKIGKPLSPYAVTKYVNELYAHVFANCYGFQTIGLRYFNVFGPRQDPEGAYAAVIPKWVDALIKGADVYINGDGETSRDFCFIQNAIQANLLAATTPNSAALNQIYNVAVGERTTLNQLYQMIQETVNSARPGVRKNISRPVYREFRSGDVRHSLADISKAHTLLGYAPSHRLAEGLKVAVPWYLCQPTASG